MAEINHEIKIEAPIETVFEAISTLEGLRSWYAKQIEGSTELGQVFEFKAEDKPTFNWKVIQVVPNRQITWECTEGPGDSVGTLVIFTLAPTEDARTLVEFEHTEWPGTEGNFRKCNTLWGILLHHLKAYAETAAAKPAYN